jgi:CRISPR-associated protein Csm1
VAQIDDVICEFCNKRIKSHNVDDNKACAICFNQIELGKQLTKKPYLTIFKSSQKEPKETIEIIKLGSSSYYAKFEEKVTTEGDSFDIDLKKGYHDYPKWSLNSYVATDENGEIKTFDKYVEKSSGLMALKADIDKLGDTFRELYKEDFRKFNRLSREVEFFFSDYIASLLKDKNIYTVFAGGDDLFIIGEYREIVKIAKDIRDEFLEFSLKKTTISMGLVMFKATTPINFVSKLADEAEQRAKIERDSIDIFGVSMKFDEFLEIENDFDDVVTYLEDNKIDTTTFYYRLIEFCDMKRDINEDIKNAMWQSKLNYIFQRNVYYKLKKDKREESLKIQHKVHQLIRIYDEKFKPSIFLKIYQNRDKTKEKKDD